MDRMSNYRVTVNLELTSKCNAKCVMCPREAVTNRQIMSLETLSQCLSRFNVNDLYRVVVAGYGEPTTHPNFAACLRLLAQTPVRVDMVSNGQLLDRERLLLMDRVLSNLIISFSSVEPAIYSQVHVNLDQQRVMANIIEAQRTLHSTQLAISLTPLRCCLDTLPQTIEWLRANGVENLTMSPTLYDRAGSMQESSREEANLRDIIQHYGLHSQELDFVPSLREVYAQWRRNRFKCIPRNAGLVIAADGSYQYCFNDMSHSYPLGHVAEMSIREALEVREASDECSALCSGCGLRDRYRPLELARALYGYLRPPKAAC